jgi:hypothetical protein
MAFDINEINRRLREAQRRMEQDFRREVDRVNRANKQAVDDYNPQGGKVSVLIARCG